MPPASQRTNRKPCFVHFIQNSWFCFTEFVCLHERNSLWSHLCWKRVNTGARDPPSTRKQDDCRGYLKCILWPLLAVFKCATCCWISCDYLCTVLLLHEIQWTLRNELHGLLHCFLDLLFPANIPEIAVITLVSTELMTTADEVKMAHRLERWLLQEEFTVPSGWKHDNKSAAPEADDGFQSRVCVCGENESSIVSSMFPVFFWIIVTCSCWLCFRLCTASCPPIETAF